jgi:predicted PurR-regulated permease PerM
MESPKRPVWSPLTKSIVILLIVALVVFFLSRFSVAVAPVVLSVILAYILNPLVTSLQTKLRIPRVAAILIVYLILFLVIGYLITLAVPVLINQIRVISSDLDLLLLQARQLFAEPIQIGDYLVIDEQELLSGITDSLQRSIEGLLEQTLDLAATVIESIVWIVFIVIISIYLIKDSRPLMEWLEKLVPPLYRNDYNHLLKEINAIWGSFFRGQLLLALVVFVIIYVYARIVGLHGAFVMAILAGLMEFLPSVGHGIWLVVALAVGFFGGSTTLPVENWVFTLIILAGHIVFTQFDLNYLIPRIIGRSVKLPPMVVILGIVAGAALAGVLGVVLAAPSIASLRVIGRYVYANLVGIEPFSDERIVEPLPPPQLIWWQHLSSRIRRGERD